MRVHSSRTITTSLLVAALVCTAACAGDDTPITRVVGQQGGAAGSVAAGHAGASAGAPSGGSGGAKGGAADAAAGSAGTAGSAGAKAGGAAGASGGSGGSKGGSAGSAGSAGAAAKCVVDSDCHTDATCGGDVCDAGTCQVAGQSLIGTEGHCAKDADCKCASLTATCAASKQCTFTTAGESPPIPAPIVGPSRGSAIAISYDDKVVVVANRDVGTVTIFSAVYPTAAAPTLTLVKEVPVGSGVQSEPWQVVIGGDNDTAYVALRGDGAVQRIGHISTAPIAGPIVAVGSEVTAVAITPSGKTVYAASWVNGTVTGLDAVTMAVTETIDLNVTLAASGLIGNVTPRPALAHPRSIAISNDGVDATDDTSETMLVTEYFAQRIAPAASLDANADTAKAGVVYSVPLSTKTPSLIQLPALADMGFQDKNGGTAGCYPNQLQAITVEGTRAHVLSICASPRDPIGASAGYPHACTDRYDCPGGFAGGPNACNDIQASNGIGACTTNCNTDSDCGTNGGTCDKTTHLCAINVASVRTVSTPVMHTIDLATGVSDAGTSLNARWSGLYAPSGLSAAFAGVKKLPLVANDFVFVAGATVGYITANGADAVFRARVDPMGAVGVGDENDGARPFIDLDPPMLTPPTAAGHNPNGIAITNTSPQGKSWGFVTNDVSRNVSVVDLGTQTLAMNDESAVAVASTAIPTDAQSQSILRGKRFFNTGLDRWSLDGAGWGACQTCHIDGLSDSVTWHVLAGARQTTSLDGTFSSIDPSDQRILEWTADDDEVADFETYVRGADGGVGAIVFQTSTPPALSDRIDFEGDGNAGLNGSAEAVADPNSGLVVPASNNDDWADIKAYVQSLRSPHAPTNLVATDVAAGADIFAANNCQGCHGGAKWTISRRFYAPNGDSDGNPTLTGALLTTPWNPPANFPDALLPATRVQDRFMRFESNTSSDDEDGPLMRLDVLQCILRPVGTFGATDGATAVDESWEGHPDTLTSGEGADPGDNGYNPPSLLGLAVGAPYFHGGNAQTLESALSDTFAAHHQALTVPTFLSSTDPNAATERRQLIAYLLSIDESTPPLKAPAKAGVLGGDFCAAP